MIAISEIKKEYGNSMALMILCCRIYFKTAELADLNAFLENNTVDWQDFFKISYIHRIRPIVYRILLKTTLPEEIPRKIKRELDIITFQNFEQAKETERLILLLKENNIHVLPYKGAAFSKQFFGNINMRESSDIDLVINPNDIPKAIEILENDGFSAYQKEYYQLIGHKNFVKKHKDFSFDKFDGTVRLHHVELHFNIIGKNTYLTDNMNTFNTNQKSKILLFQKEIECLKPTEHFKAILLHHMFMDNMGYLKTIVDISQALIHLDSLENKKEIDPVNQLILNELNTNYNLGLIRQMISNLIGIEFIQKQIIKSEISLIDKILNSSYQKVRGHQFPLFEAIQFNYDQIKYTSCFYNSNSDKIINFLKRIISISYPQPEDCMTVRLNKNFYFLYYFIRPFRLIFFPGDPNKK